MRQRSTISVRARVCVFGTCSFWRCTRQLLFETVTPPIMHESCGASNTKKCIRRNRTRKICRLPRALILPGAASKIAASGMSPGAIRKPGIVLSEESCIPEARNLVLLMRSCHRSRIGFKADRTIPPDRCTQTIRQVKIMCFRAALSRTSAPFGTNCRVMATSAMREQENTSVGKMLLCPERGR